MFKAIFFLIKLSALVALSVYVADLPGAIQLEMYDYVFTMDFGFFLMLMTVVILITIFIFNVIMTIIRLPAQYRRYRDIRHQEKGYRALTLGLTAVAAGDRAMAERQAALTRYYLKHDDGLAILLQAQAARLSGKEKIALRAFATLLSNKDAAFLGLRGLLQTALDHKNHKKALELAYRALSLHPKQPWIIRLVYDLEIEMRQWDAALDTLGKARAIKAIDKTRAHSDYGALLLARADDLALQGDHKEALSCTQKAHAHDPAFTPAALRLAKMYIDQDKRGRALKVLEKSWKAEPHPDIAQIWRDTIAPKKAGDGMERMKWFEKLYKLNSKSARANLEAGHVAMTEALWGKARTYLERAEERDPSKELYEMLADLERLSGRGEISAKRWKAMAQSAPETRAWVCMNSGRTYCAWSPLAAPHGHFNSIKWALPDASTRAHNHPDITINHCVIDTPQKI